MDKEGSKVEYESVVDVDAKVEAGDDELRYQTKKSKEVTETKNPEEEKVDQKPLAPLEVESAIMEALKDTPNKENKASPKKDDSAENF